MIRRRTSQIGSRSKHLSATKLFRPRLEWLEERNAASDTLNALLNNLAVGSILDPMPSGQFAPPRAILGG